MLAIVPVTNTAPGTLAPERMKNASGLFNLMRNLGGAIGLAAINTLLNDRMDRHIVLSLHEAPLSVLLKCTSSAEARAADQSRSLPRLQLVQLHALRVAWRPGCDSPA